MTRGQQDGWRKDPSGRRPDNRRKETIALYSHARYSQHAQARLPGCRHSDLPAFPYNKTPPLWLAGLISGLEGCVALSAEGDEK